MRYAFLYASEKEKYNIKSGGSIHSRTLPLFYFLISLFCYLWILLSVRIIRIMRIMRIIRIIRSIRAVFFL